MAVAALRFITEEEYLALEEASDVKHEYHLGQIYAMAGGSPEHAQICSGLERALGNALRGSSCKFFNSDLRVRVERTGLYTYPDVTVVCGDLQRTDQKPASILNPTILAEVLSESTRDYDLGGKWRHYQTIPSLTDYLVVWQDRPRVEHYHRLQGDFWTYLAVDGLDGSIEMPDLGAILALEEVYRGVDFPAEPPPTPNDRDKRDEWVSDGHP